MVHETNKNDAACQDKRFIYGSYMSLMNYIESFLVVIEDLNSELSPGLPVLLKHLHRHGIPQLPYHLDGPFLLKAHMPGRS
jgi:hypothetical protein